MRIRPALLVASAVLLLAVLAGGWLLLRPVDPAGRSVPAPITVTEPSPAPTAPTPLPPAPTPDPAPPETGPSDVVPPPPIDDDDDDEGPDDEGPDDDGPDDDD